MPEKRRLAPEPTAGAFLTVKELADWLGVGQATVRNWCEQNRLPFFKIENQFRFDPDEIEDWLQARYHPATRD